MTRSKNLRWPDPPEALAFLGRAVALGVGRGEELQIGKGYFIAADPKGGILVIGPDDLAADVSHRDPNDPARRAARAVREKFQGRIDGHEWEIHNFPRSWKALGVARSVVYESDKSNGGGPESRNSSYTNFPPVRPPTARGNFWQL